MPLVKFLSDWNAAVPVSFFGKVCELDAGDVQPPLYVVHDQVCKADEKDLPKHCPKARLRRLFEISPRWYQCQLGTLMQAALPEGTKVASWLLLHARVVQVMNLLTNDIESMFVSKFGLVPEARKFLAPEIQSREPLALV